MMTYEISEAGIEGMDYVALRDAYMRFEWTVRGFVSLDTYTRSMGDMRHALVRAVRAGIAIREFPSHPADYQCRVADLYNALPPDTFRAMAEQQNQAGKAIFPDPGDTALWGKGWFGDVLPGYMGTQAWHPSAPMVEGVQYISALPGVERTRLQDYRSKGLTDELQPIEEAAADGDFLSHLKIRALFAGVASVMGATGDFIVHAALNLPVPTLAAYVRIYRHRDTPPYNVRTGKYGKSASEAAFEAPGFYERAIERGQRMLAAAGGCQLPDLMMASPLSLMVGDVEVQMHFPRFLAVDGEVVDIVGLDAAQAAMAKASEELALYGIVVGPVQIIS